LAHHGEGHFAAPVPKLVVDAVAPLRLSLSFEDEDVTEVEAPADFLEVALSLSRLTVLSR
jgi:hypothetical protein